MSIEKIGKADPGATIDLYRQAMQRHQQRPKAPAGNDIIVRNNESSSEKGGQEKVKYAPFFPVGDTQSIHKK